jgi:hypothetical protein
VSARRDLRALGEIALTVVATWLLLGWLFDRAIEQADASVLVVPYVASALRAGVDWTHHLYRFGVIGGSEMQPVGGAVPFVQLCAALGVSATTTVNALTCVLQLLVAFLGTKTAEALATTWRGESRTLTAAERVVATWLCAFAPMIGWRVALGDDHVVLGLLPFVAATTLAWCARAGTMTVTTVVVAAVAVAHGVSGIGAQSVVYGATLGAPIVIAAFARRWTAAEWVAVGAVVGGALVMVPRLIGMVAYAGGIDAARSISESVTFSYGTSTWSDWAGSLAWTRALAPGDVATLQERNIPIGPLVIVIAATREARRLGAVVLACAVVAVLLANDVWPASELSRLPLVGAFRAPARAILTALVLVAPLAVAAFAVRRTPERTRAAIRLDALAIAVAALVILGGSVVPGVAREVVAWGACVGLVVALRRRPRFAFGALAVVAALGVVAFDERFPRDAPHQRIEDLAELRDALVAQAPELASQLTRVEVVDPPRPYEMSTGFAAGLSTLDGVWYPPRRFLALLAAIKGREVPVTTCVFGFARDSAFAVLQQLYDVEVAVAIRPNGVELERLPATNGGAWFPTRIDVAGDDAIGAALRASTDLRADLAATAWRDDDGAAPSSCAGARVTGVTTDAEGQRASIAVATAVPCTLVIATNYVSSLVATDDAGHELPTFPIDIALTGVMVPANAASVELAPRAYLSWWSYVLALLGIALIALAAARTYRSA